MVLITPGYQPRRSPNNGSAEEIEGGIN